MLMSNLNFLSPINFQFQLSNVPHVEFLVQKVSVPGMNLGTASTSTPFTRIVNPGNITYNDLTIVFKIDEDMNAYNEIFDWMEALGHPDSFEQYKNVRSDANLMVLGSNRRELFNFTFTDVYPSNISGLDFDTTLNDVQYLNCMVSFSFNRMFRKRPNLMTVSS